MERQQRGPDAIAPEQPLPVAATPSVNAAPSAPPAAAPDEPGVTPFPDIIAPAAGRSPRIVSVTLTGSNRDLIGDALRSVVDWVDACVVVDTGATDDTLAVAREVAGDKLIVTGFPWQQDFAAARNAAFTAARQTGADWVVILDTDERIELAGTPIAAVLATATADGFFVPHDSGTYAKERFFRLPVKGRFVGPTHEFFDAAGAAIDHLAGIRFAEVGKDAEGYRRKFERDVAILTRHTAAHPHDPRWFYYLGDALNGLGRYPEAITAFRACAALKGWDEEGAWALYRAAECALRLGHPTEAVALCAVGLERHAGLAELAWQAAYASWQARQPEQAVHWARLSIAMGRFAGAGDSVPRRGFRNPRALYEGPYDVLRFALRAVGDTAGADEAERLFQAAAAAREAARAT